MGKPRYKNLPFFFFVKISLSISDKPKTHIDQADFEFRCARIKGMCHLTQFAIFFTLIFFPASVLRRGTIKTGLHTDSQSWPGIHNVAQVDPVPKDWGVR